MRLTSNDKSFGPLTWGPAHKGVFSFYYSTGGGDEGFSSNGIYLYVFGLVLRLKMPRILKPHRIWVPVDHPNAKNGGYWDVNEKNYGFRISDDFYSIYYGAQTHDSRTTKSVHGTIPFLTWRYHRFSIFSLDGREVHREYPREQHSGSHEANRKIQEANSGRALFKDYDGTEIIATYHVNEREWRFGGKGFKWLSLFRKPLVRRVLELSFDKEVGRDKGTWKGGITGMGIDMLPYETPAAAMVRFCEMEMRGKHGNSRLEFIVHLGPSERGPE